MGKLTDNLKRVLECLTYQDAAEYLSTDQKVETLGVEPAGAQGRIPLWRREPALRIQRDRAPHCPDLSRR